MRTPTIVLAVVIWAALGCGKAAAWGCDGHRTVVFLAERLLTAPILSAAKAVLAASPIDPSLTRFCDPVPDDPLADEATWADDYRAVDGATAGWHFVNVPRQSSLTASNEPAFCHSGNCVVDAIAAQYHTLTTSQDAKARANALRF